MSEGQLSSAEPVVVPVETLQKFLVSLFTRKGMFGVEAETAAQRLIEADLRGIPECGTKAVPWYLASMDSGDIDPRAQSLTLMETAAIALVEDGKGLGPVAATRAMQLAIKKARDVGTGTVVVRRSQPLGAAVLYALLAAEEGLIGFCSTTSGPGVISTNGELCQAEADVAMAWAVPTGGDAPFLIDLACPHAGGAAQSATGGTALAFLCSALAGPLAGRKMARRRTRSALVEGSDHFFYAIDVQQFGEGEKYAKELAATLEELNDADDPTAASIRAEAQVRDRAAAWRAEGLPMTAEHAEALASLARPFKIEVPW